MKIYNCQARFVGAAHPVHINLSVNKSICGAVVIDSAGPTAMELGEESELESDRDDYNRPKQPLVFCVYIHCTCTCM